MSEKIKDIVECLKKYANLTPDAIDDLYYLEGTIEDLQQKVEQLENIIKKAIEYVYKHIQEYDVDGTFTNLDEFDFIASPQTLLNILNKGDNNGK